MSSSGIPAASAPNDNPFGALANGDPWVPPTDWDVELIGNPEQDVDQAMEPMRISALKAQESLKGKHSDIVFNDKVGGPEYARGEEGLSQRLVHQLVQLKTPHFSQYFGRDPLKNKTSDADFDKVVVTLHGDPQAPHWLGTFNPKGTNYVRGRWNLHSLAPSYTVEFLNGDGERAYVSIWFNGLKAEDGIHHYAGAEMANSGYKLPNDNEVGRHQGYAELKANKLCATRFNLLKAEEVEKVAHKGKNFRPTITNLSKERLLQIYNRASMEDAVARPGDPAVTHGEFFALAIVHGCVDFTIARVWRDTWTADYDEFKVHVNDLTKLSIAWGNAWWYKLQLPRGIELSHCDIDFDALVPLRADVIEWGFEFRSDIGGRLKALAVRPIKFGKPNVAPDAKTVAFLQRLNSAREEVHSTAQIHQLQEDISQSQLSCKFLKKIPGWTGFMLLGINFGEKYEKSSKGDDPPKPNEGARVTIHIQVKGWPEPIELRGSICDDHLHWKTSFCAKVHTIDHRDHPALDGSKGPFKMTRGGIRGDRGDHGRGGNRGDRGNRGGN